MEKIYTTTIYQFERIEQGDFSKKYIIDENSTNGTYVNGIRIQSQQTVEISPGDRITLADLELTVTNVSGGETIR